MSTLNDPAFRDRWVAWRYVARAGRKTKCPFDPKTGREAASDDPSTWATHAQAERFRPSDGVGVMLGPLGDGRALCGVDLDTCRDPATGKILPWARDIIDRVDSSPEISPSQTGVKVYFTVDADTLPEFAEATGNKHGKSWRNGKGPHPPAIELHWSSRFYAVTGDALDARPLRHVPASDVRWIVNEAGPRFAGVAPDTKPKDESRSGSAWRLAEEIGRSGGVRADFEEALERDPELADWATDERQVTRAWERNGLPALEERQRLINRFDDLGEDNAPRHKRTPLRFVSVGDLAAMPEPFDFVRDVLHDGAFSVMFGAPGTGKSFLALDIAAHVSLGRPWARRDTEQRGCVIIALEGVGGQKRRVRAWSLHYHDEPPLTFGLGHLDLRNPEHLKPIIEHIKASGARFVIIDTLARALSGGNENAPDDMGALIRGADAIRQHTGAHVMLIHHTGKDEARGSRGHSSLKGAADVEIEVSRNGEHRMARVTKAKDGPEGVAFAFTLKPIETDLIDARGERITSAVVCETEGFEDLEADMKLSDREHEALDVLRRLNRFAEINGPASRTEWRAALDTLTTDTWPPPTESGSARRTAFARAMAGLENKRVVTFRRDDRAELLI